MTFKTISNIHIIHYIYDTRYLCNRAVNITLEKYTYERSKVTCRNCIRLLKKIGEDE